MYAKNAGAKTGVISLWMDSASGYVLLNEAGSDWYFGEKDDSAMG